MMTQLTMRRICAVAAVIGLLFAPLASADTKDVNGWSDEIGYIAKRGVTVIETNDGPALIVLETEFDADPDADLWVKLGRDGRVDQEMSLGKLSMIRGLQVFEVPGQINLEAFNELHIINGQDGQPIGAAELR